ncbi:hypothetical protein SEA_VANLEE_161 [Gordonia phage VanLee]|uniref:DUF2786 domain-containing protein n=1 Tax=Gordonia phage VanLee TaxID=2845816 RepID=A0A8F2IFL1_9CAUD|nr:hypothetical protein QEH49_gp129 [Gordonia phage VanLee]QWS68277.1 hypothetical protein SEA_VANLEE_161 [Gordonia phage VanLee]
MTENNNDKLADKVRKLLEKARAVAGTPEADVFNAKAFELVAEYGLDPESIVRSKANAEDSKLIVSTFPFSDFAVQRIELLWAIAMPLHCAGIAMMLPDGRRGVKIYGVNRHMKRVKLLHGLLSNQMLAGASKVVPNNPFADRNSTGIDERRAAWMKGFADGVMVKITEVEEAAIRQADRNAGDTQYAVARMSDRQRAQAAMDAAHPGPRGSFKGTGYGTGYAEGRAAGRQSDVGQTRVGAGAQHALT